MAGFSLNPVDWITEAAAAAGAAGFDAAAGWVADGVAWFVGIVGGELYSLVADPAYETTRLFDLGGPAANLKYIGVAVIVAGMFVSVAATLRGGQSGHEALMEIPLLVVGTSVVVMVGTMVLGVCDGLAGVFFTQNDAWQRFAEFGDAPGFVRLVLAFIAFAVMLLTFVELAMRNLLVLVALAVMPVGLGMRAWPIGRELMNYMVRGFIALALQPVLVALAVWSMPAPRLSDLGFSLAGSLVQLAALTLVATAPALVFKLVPIDVGGGGGFGVMRGAAMAGAAVGVGAAKMGARAAGPLGAAAAAGVSAVGAAAGAVSSRLSGSRMNSDSSDGGPAAGGADRTQTGTGGGDGGGGQPAGGSSWPAPSSDGDSVSGDASRSDGSSTAVAEPRAVEVTSGDAGEHTGAGQ